MSMYFIINLKILKSPLIYLCNPNIIKLPVYIHALIVLLVFARSYVVHPFLVLEVPADSFFDSFLELQAGSPAQFALELARVDGVPQIVACAVGDVRDKLLRRPLGVAQQPVHRPYDDPYQVDVLPLVEAPDVVRLGDLAPVEDHVDGPRMVFHVQPVAHVLPAAVHRQRPSVADVVDEQRDELLRELVGPVVVRAVRDRGAKPVGAGPGAHEHVGARLGRTVRRARVVRRLLGELGGVVERQVAVDLVGGNVVVADAVLADSLQQAEGALDVGAEKGLRIGDGIVVVALGCVVHDRIVPRDDAIQQLGVADVAHDELHAVGGQPGDVLGVAGVGQLVQDGDVDVRVVVHDIVHEIAADEAAASSDDNVLRFKLLRHD